MSLLAAEDDWTELLRRTLEAYDEALLRQVANKLCRPRNQWPVDELIERTLAALQNPVLLDRRLKDVTVGARHLLALMARSRQPRWPLGSLVELGFCLGEGDGVAPLLELLESGLLMPDLLPRRRSLHKQNGLPTSLGRLRSFEHWLATSASEPLSVVAPPLVLKRALQEETGLPACPGAVPSPPGRSQEADGLDWPLRLAVLWQQVLGAPLRRTQQRDFFKRDFDRLRSDPLLGAAPNDALAPPPDPGLFTVALAAATGLLQEDDAELEAGSFSPAWKEGLPDVLAELWAALPWVHGWNPAAGYSGMSSPGNPYPSAYLLAVLLLTRLADDEWCDPAALDAWFAVHHPYWQGQRSTAIGAATFLLGVAYPLRLVQARPNPDGGHLVRLSVLGRWLVGEGDLPAVPTFPQTLLVQPNLEILAYRQGLTPDLIVRLSRLATWKGLGPACTLQLEPHSIYRALEAGETMQSLVQLLERHGTKALPGPVVDSLRTWSNKRERISLYTSAALFEFATAGELTEALARGLPAVRLTDRLAIVANEKDIDYRHFRLTGTRDFCLPPEKCVDVESDGVTLSVDLSRSDLLLETELLRFAEPLQTPSQPGRRLYRVTPATIAVGRQNGLTEAALQTWFQQRTGQSTSPAARLFLAGPDAAPLMLRRQLVLHVSSTELADGLQQWPATRSLILTRIGPTALVIAEENAILLAERLHEAGVELTDADAVIEEP